MATNFLSLSVDLASARTLAAKKKISNEMGKFLSSDREFATMLIRPLITAALSSIDPVDEIMQGEFFKIRQEVYVDVDNKIKIAVGVIFLQDHNNSDFDLDRVVIENLIKNFKNKNLDLLVNDITVNLTQVRDGDTGSLL